MKQLKTRTVNLSLESEESLPLTFYIKISAYNRLHNIEISDSFRDELAKCTNGYFFTKDNNRNLVMKAVDSLDYKGTPVVISDKTQVKYQVNNNTILEEGYFFAIKTGEEAYTLLKAEYVLSESELRWLNLGYTITRPHLCPIDKDPHKEGFYKYKDNFDTLSVLLDNGEYELFKDNSPADYDRLINKYSIAYKKSKSGGYAEWFRFENN